MAVSFNPLVRFGDLDRMNFKSGIDMCNMPEGRYGCATGKCVSCGALVKEVKSLHNEIDDLKERLDDALDELRDIHDREPW
jgi:hypothetical protein